MDAVMRCAMTAIALLVGACANAPQASLALDQDDAHGVLTVMLDGHQAFAYRYGPECALPHLYPVNTPAGQPLTAQHPDPFPHHRSLWIADRVQIAGGPDIDFYHEWKNLRDPKRPELGHHAFIRGDAVTDRQLDDSTASFTTRHTWIVADDQPVLADTRHFVVRDLGDGEYLIDLAWELRAEFGEVRFLSDPVHYAWPFVRMDPAFSVDHGGTMVDDQGRSGQAATHDQIARFVDCSSTVDGEQAGLALFVWPDGEPHRWLTRDYGTFGPRRAAPWHGTGFTLGRGEAIRGRVGILVHRGDAASGRVEERYADWIGAAR